MHAPDIDPTHSLQLEDLLLLCPSRASAGYLARVLHQGGRRANVLTASTSSGLRLRLAAERACTPAPADGFRRSIFKLDSHFAGLALVKEPGAYAASVTRNSQGRSKFVENPPQLEIVESFGSGAPLCGQPETLI